MRHDRHHDLLPGAQGGRTRTRPQASRRPAFDSECRPGQSSGTGARGRKPKSTISRMPSSWSPHGKWRPGSFSLATRETLQSRRFRCTPRFRYLRSLIPRRRRGLDPDANAACRPARFAGGHCYLMVPRGTSTVSQDASSFQDTSFSGFSSDCPNASAFDSAVSVGIEADGHAVLMDLGRCHEDPRHRPQD